MQNQLQSEVGLYNTDVVATSSLNNVYRLPAKVMELL